MERTFLTASQRLWPQHIPLLVGLSGGVDSMTLLALLTHCQTLWPVTLIPVHVDHGLRDASSAEADWLKHYIDTIFGLPLRIFSTTVISQPGESMEMAARRVRYGYFNKILEEYGEQSQMVLGHHAQDQAETVLMRIIAGTSLEGLRGMNAVNGHFIRPMLSFTRKDILRYAKTMNLKWIEDQSNTDRNIARNRIRLEVLPYLRTINPRVDTHLLGLADRAREAYVVITAFTEQFLESKTEVGDNQWILSTDFYALPTAVKTDVLATIGKRLGLRLGENHIIAALTSSTVWPEGYSVRHGPTDISISLFNQAKPQQFGEWPREKLQIGINPIWEGTVQVKEDRMPHTPIPGRLYVNRVLWPEIGVRTWQAGDKMRPLGLKGHKKVQDIFVDKKISREARSLWPILTGIDNLGNEVVLGILNVTIAEQARSYIGQDVYEVLWDKSGIL